MEYTVLSNITDIFALFWYKEHQKSMHFADWSPKIISLCAISYEPSGKIRAFS